MKKAWVIGMSVAALIALCIGVLLALNPFSEPILSELSNVYEYRLDYIYIRDIDEYHNYIAAEDGLPDEFVTAEMLSGFGRFERFNADPCKLSVGYCYDLVAENGDKIVIYVDHDLSNNMLFTHEMLSVSDVGTSMRELAEKEKGLIVRNGVEYFYLDGKLVSIEWTTSNIGFTIVTDGSWSDYSTLSADSLLYRLLSVSETEFESALSELESIIPKKSHTTEWIVCFAILLIAAVCLLCARKRISKRIAEKRAAVHQELNRETTSIDPGDQTE